MKYLEPKRHKCLYILRSNITLRFNKTKSIEKTNTNINTSPKLCKLTNSMAMRLRAKA